MSRATGTAETAAKLHPAFVEKMVRTFNDSSEHGVHFLFNEWWEHAPDSTIEGYHRALREMPGGAEFLAARHLAPAVTLDELAAHPEGSVGLAYHRFLTENGLESNLAANYGKLHDHMLASGQLDRMPDDLKYAITRGFQIHDLLHVITGYTPSGLDELALQAFCLAQMQFPYFGMWVATTTANMTFLRPEAIVPVMDAISSGWRYGRSVENLQFERWETLFEAPLSEVRPRYGITPEGMGAAV